jgi:hypothetical protein
MEKREKKNKVFCVTKCIGGERMLAAWVEISVLYLRPCKQMLHFAGELVM